MWQYISQCQKGGGGAIIGKGAIFDGNTILVVYQMGRLCGGAHEISGIKAQIFLRGWVGGGGCGVGGVGRGGGGRVGRGEGSWVGDGGVGVVGVQSGGGWCD